MTKHKVGIVSILLMLVGFIVTEKIFQMIATLGGIGLALVAISMFFADEVNGK
jgi:hypothetical protein